MPSQSFLSNPQNNPYSMSLKLTELHFSGITGGGRGVRMPQRLLTGKILLTYWDKRGKEKMEKGGNGEGKKENCKKEGGKLKMEGGKSSKMRRGLFFFFFFFLLFTFKTTKICFRSTKMEIFTNFTHDWNAHNARFQIVGECIQEKWYWRHIGHVSLGKKR